MTREALNKIAKAHGVSLDAFANINAWINEKYTKVMVTFANRENLGGNAYYYNHRFISLSVAAIMKRDEDPADYTTQSWEWISDIR